MKVFFGGDRRTNLIQIKQRFRVPAVDVPDLYRDIWDVNVLAIEGVFGGVRRTNLIKNSNIPAQ